MKDLLHYMSAVLALDDCELSKLGISIHNAQGEIKPFEQIVGEVWEKIVEDVVNDSIRQR